MTVEYQKPLAELDLPILYPADPEIEEKYPPTTNNIDRPEGIPEDFVFKGWALDPAGGEQT